MTAEALGTAVFFLGLKKDSPCQKLGGVDWLIMEKEGRNILSPGLKD